MRFMDESLTQSTFAVFQGEPESGTVLEGTWESTVVFDTPGTYFLTDIFLLDQAHNYAEFFLTIGEWPTIEVLP